MQPSSRVALSEAFCSYLGVSADRVAVPLLPTAAVLVRGREGSGSRRPW